MTDAQGERGSRPAGSPRNPSLLAKEAHAIMTDAESGAVSKTNEELLKERDILQKELNKMKLELDILIVAAEILKKGLVVDMRAASALGWSQRRAG